MSRMRYILFLLYAMLPIRSFGIGFCATSALHEQVIPSIDEVDDPTGLNERLKEILPIIYLDEKETAFPIAAEDYFLNAETALIGQDGAVVIPAGKITFEALDARTRALWKKGIRDDNSYFAIPECVFKGSSPKRYTGENGELTTPASFITFVANGRRYVQCLFFYGYNSPYEIEVAGVTLFSGDQYEFQNAHEADLEHITIELDGVNSTRIRRIFYGAHGSREGMWVPISMCEKEGTHPIVYAARGGHGNYPYAGTWVRIYGFANDITGKGTRWEPTWQRVYLPFNPDSGLPTDDRWKDSEPELGYDPKTMGWIMHAGKYGKRGVSSMWSQWWFGVVDQSDRLVQTARKMLCPTSGGYSCVRRKAPFAEIPGGSPKELEMITRVWQKVALLDEATDEQIKRAKEAILELHNELKHQLKLGNEKAKEVVSYMQRKTEELAKDLKKYASDAWGWLQKSLKF